MAATGSFQDYARIVREKAEQRRTRDIADRFARAALRSRDERRAQVRDAIRFSTNLISESTAAGWQTYTLEDAYEPREPLVYVVDSLFSLPSLSIVYGAPGCLKSMLMLDMALCVAEDNAGYHRGRDTLACLRRTRSRSRSCVSVSSNGSLALRPSGTLQADATAVKFQYPRTDRWH